MRAPLIWQIIGEKDSGSVNVDLKVLNPNTETKPYAAIICQPEEEVISTEEIQFNHKPAKMLSVETKRESAKMAKPQV